MRIDRSTAAELADGVMRQLRFHSEYIDPPSGYQFTLPDGLFLTLNDYLIKGGRVLYFYSYTPVRVARQVSASLGRPRRLPQEGPWFVGLTDRQHRRAHRRIRYAIEFAGRGADDKREPKMLLLDPSGPVRRVEELPWERRPSRTDPAG